MEGVGRVLLPALNGGFREAYVARNEQQISPIGTQHVETKSDADIQNILLLRTHSPSQTS